MNPLLNPPASPGRLSVRARRRPAAVVWLTLGVVVTLAACASAGGAPDLDGRTFESTEVTGRTLVDGSTIRLSFREGGVSAVAGCNTLVGDATWDDGELVAPLLASTMMACEDDLMEQDQWLAGFLEGSPSLELDGNTLTLSSADEEITLTEVDA